VAHFNETLLGHSSLAPKNRALAANHLEGELELRALGAIRYKDTSPMGLYGIVLQEGATALPSLVADLPFWNTGYSSMQ
jgi:hypothetical protein